MSFIRMKRGVKGQSEMTPAHGPAFEKYTDIMDCSIVTVVLT